MTIEMSRKDNMAIELTKGREILMLIAVFLTNIATMGDYIIYPITYNFFNAFPDNVNGVNFILSGPSLILIFVALATPKIIKWIGSRNTLILGCVLFTLPGIFGVAVLSIPYIITLRVINAIGIGIVNVTAVVVLTEIYIDEKKRGTILGFYSTAMAAVGAILSNASGFLATIEWTRAYWVYLSGIVMVFLVIMFVPVIKSMQKEIDEEKTSEIEQNITKEPLGAKFWIFTFIIIFFYTSFCVPSFFNSVYIAENGLGNAAFSGFVTSLTTISGALIGLLFGKIFMKTKSITNALAYLILALCIGAMYFFPTKTTVMVSNFIAGAMMTVAFTYALTYCPSIVPESRINDSLGITQAVCGIAMFSVTYVVTFLMNVFNTELVTPVYIVPAIVMLIAAAAEYFTRNKGEMVQN